MKGSLKELKSFQNSLCFLVTFSQEAVATVVKAVFAVFGAGEASEGGETGSEEDGELDHSGEEIESDSLCWFLKNLNLDWMACGEYSLLLITLREHFTSPQDNSL